MRKKANNGCASLTMKISHNVSHQVKYNLFYVCLCVALCIYAVISLIFFPSIPRCSCVGGLKSHLHNILYSSRIVKLQSFTVSFQKFNLSFVRSVWWFLLRCNIILHFFHLLKSVPSEPFRFYVTSYKLL